MIWGPSCQENKNLILVSRYVKHGKTSNQRHVGFIVIRVESNLGDDVAWLLRVPLLHSDTGSVFCGRCLSIQDITWYKNIDHNNIDHSFYTKLIAGYSWKVKRNQISSRQCPTPTHRCRCRTPMTASLWRAAAWQEVDSSSVFHTVGRLKNVKKKLTKIFPYFSYDYKYDYIWLIMINLWLLRKIKVVSAYYDYFILLLRP